MTRVLLISYFFPPIGMAGAARAYALYRYLPEFGFQTHVVTVKDIAYPAHDYTLLTESDLRRITRSGSLDPSRLMRILGRKQLPSSRGSKRSSQWITPDYKTLWAPFARRAAERVLKSHNCSLIITTSPPPSLHQVGLDLQERHQVKWIADFRDMWFTRPIEEVYTSARQKSKSKKLLAQVRMHADDIVAVNPSVANYVGAKTVIPNGADPLTFTDWDKPESADAVYRIGYLGTTENSHATKVFAATLKSALDTTNLDAADCKVVYVGSVDRDMLRREFAEAGVEDSLEIHSYGSRSEAIATLRKVDLLLATVSDESLAHVTTSKVFDYLVSGKKICAIAPAGGELATVMQDEGERVFAPAEPRALREFLAAELKQKRFSKELYRVTDETLNTRRARYSWRTLAMRMAERLRGLI